MARFLTISDLAERWQVTTKSIYNLRSRGSESDLPPALTIGKSLRWRPEDVEAWEAAQLPGSNVFPISSRQTA